MQHFLNPRFFVVRETERATPARITVLAEQRKTNEAKWERRNDILACIIMDQ